MAVIRKDSLGLYIIHDSTIIRPFFGTNFQEGMKVKCKTVSQTSIVKVEQETWGSTGIPSYDYRNKTFIPNQYSRIYGNYDTWEQYLQLNYEWSEKYVKSNHTSVTPIE